MAVELSKLASDASALATSSTPRVGIVFTRFKLDGLGVRVRRGRFVDNVGVGAAVVVVDGVV